MCSSSFGAYLEKLHGVLATCTASGILFQKKKQLRPLGNTMVLGQFDRIEPYKRWEIAFIQGNNKLFEEESIMLNGRLKSRKALREFSIPFGYFQCLLASSHYENCTPLERKYQYLFRLMVPLQNRFELWPREKFLTVPSENRTTF